MADVENVLPVSLNPDQFFRLCSRLGIEPRPRAARVEVRAPIMIALAKDGELEPPIKSTLRDFSLKDATLTHHEPLANGQQVVFYVEATRILMRVESCKGFADGTAMLRMSYLGIIEPQFRFGGAPMADSPAA